jgi:hypothetical protein
MLEWDEEEKWVAFFAYLSSSASLTTSLFGVKRLYLIILLVQLYLLAI